MVNHDTTNCKISDNLADSCKTYCKICGEAHFLTAMRSHTLGQHGIQITKYKMIHGPFEIIEKVFHKCHICGKIVLLDSDAMGGHIKGTHHMKEKDYKEKYCTYGSETEPRAAVNKKKKKIMKLKKKIRSFDPFIDIEYGCNLRDCDQCGKSSLVVELTNMNGGKKKTEPKEE